MERLRNKAIVFTINDSSLLIYSRLQELPGVEHGFGTRRAGWWVAADACATVKQTHSDRIWRADHAGKLGEGDALVTNVPGLFVAVRTADCIPILMADPRHGAVAAVHAGWRGTVADIAGKTVQEMTRLYKTNPSDLLAAIGPGIGQCCFEVGPEVAVQFRKLFPERDDLDRRTHIDLAEANRRELAAAGVDPARIECAGMCTYCTGERFESFRRDRERSGRMVSAIGYTKGAGEPAP